MAPAPIRSPRPTAALRARFEAALAAGASALEEDDAKAALAEIGIPVPRGLRLAPRERAPAALAPLRPPFVLKALASVPLHKSDIGAVVLGLADGGAVEAARADMAARLEAAGVPLTGFLVEEMARPGIELVFGGVTDPQLGPMLMIGAGGIYAEILDDVAFRLCPIGRRDAEEMLGELKIAPILRGARGRRPVSSEALVDALLALGGEDGLFTRQADVVSEFDLNPVIAGPDGLTAVDARFVLRRGEAPAEPAAADPAVVERFRPLFEPRAIAVAGASAKGGSAGNRFIRYLRESGYSGALYPIHPNAREIDGLPAYATLAETPEPVDYAYLTVPAGQVASVLKGAGGHVRFAQVMATGDPETTAAWERDLGALAAREGLRLIGPNCMGTHSPRGRITFMDGALMEEGGVGIASQSGGLGMDILRRGQALGLRFSGLVTLGNSVDVQPADLLEYYLADPNTAVVGLYVEDVKDGRRFRALAQANAGRKPIVILLGGTTPQGRKAAASHTGALGGTGRAWEALARETGLILTRTLDAFLDALQICRCLAPRRVEDGAPEITLFGNGGGTSVLATDCIARAGFALSAMTEDALAEFGGLKLPSGASLANPIDVPASVLQQDQGRISARILEIARRRTRPYAVVAHVNLPVILGYRHVPDLMPNLIDALLASSTGPGAPHLLLALRSDGTEEVDGWKRQFRAAASGRNVPTFDEIPQTVEALAAFCAYERFLTRRADDSPAGGAPGRPA